MLKRYPLPQLPPLKPVPGRIQPQTLNLYPGCEGRAARALVPAACTHSHGMGYEGCRFIVMTDSTCRVKGSMSDFTASMERLERELSAFPRKNSHLTINLH